ncbi:cell cycle control protein 50A-like isoform X2 [Acipenser ruthenus]|uniref:cell cycle control protein 50A-like isoform X2 n=1 Tax=Acipenser ruthenus TaxID=7906 RepID=UPI002742653D|nr:cell cycle control protein 50A-like isoform X2 [Acipenser ruthenus]
MSNRKDPPGSQPFMKRPDNTAFKQQKLPAWSPTLKAETVLPFFFLSGVACIMIGVLLCITAAGVQEIKGDVFMYYGLTNFHQNQRHYMVSRDNAQLVGRQYNLKNPSITCIPFDKYKNGTPIAPCGAIANSIFNDTLQLFYHPDKNTETPVPLLKTDISWFTDRTVKFQNPSPKDNLTAAFAGTARPFYWRKPVYQLSVEKNNNGFVNEDLIVWMRQAAFPSFKKLYRRLNRTQEFNEGLPAGNYSVKISYNYPVGKFKGRKSVILSTVSRLGGHSNFLGVAYCASGAIILIVAIFLTVVHLKFRKKSLGLEEE